MACEEVGFHAEALLCGLDEGGVGCEPGVCGGEAEEVVACVKAAEADDCGGIIEGCGVGFYDGDFGMGGVGKNEGSGAGMELGGRHC